MPQEIIGPLLSIGAALELPVIGYVLLALVLAGVVSFATTPLVKALSVKVGAIDVPRDGRRMHDHPIPRMGGLAIFLGFIISVLLLMPLDQPKQGMLLGAVIIVVLGIFDDIYALSAKLKFVVQIAAACVAVFSGNRIEVLSNPNIFSSNPYWELGVLSVPVTIIWIVALTNAVNLIDGLDGLATGVTTMAAVFFTAASVTLGAGIEPLTAAVTGALIGFLLFNVYPAKVFMGDTGSLALGGFVAGAAYAMRLPMFILIIGLIYWVEIFSVMIQVTYFKKTGGKRFFKMAPIHHHFELCGWSETRVVTVFTVITALLCVIGLVGLN